MQWCRRLIAERHTSKGGYDAVHLLLRLAIALHDEELALYCVDRLVTRLEAPDENRAMATSMWARCRLWWDQTSAEDTTASSREFTPAGDALACLARWRLGLTRLDDPAAMAAFADANPDAEGEGRLAQAAALLALDRPAEAVEVLEAMIVVLAPASRDDFLNRQLLELARALHATALLAAGERNRAIGIGHQLVPELDPELLPGRLVHEVLLAAEERG